MEIFESDKVLIDTLPSQTSRKQTLLGLEKYPPGGDVCLCTYIMYMYLGQWLSACRMCPWTRVGLVTYHLLTESEVITGKSQTEALMY